MKEFWQLRSILLLLVWTIASTSTVNAGAVDRLAAGESGSRVYRRTHHQGNGQTAVINKQIALQAPLGANVFMNCPVTIGEDMQVSWIRRRDFRILASGKTSYVNDDRFRVLHADGSAEWTLQIKYVALSDAQIYECQVSTSTGIVTYLYNVSVLIPATSIQGGDEYHLDKGSTIQLVCIINNVPVAPQFVFWYHNDRMINYDPNDDGRVHVETMNGPLRDSQALSRLTISKALDTDSGNYTCSPSNAPAASTIVYVSEGDEAAAIQVDNSTPSTHKNINSVPAFQLLGLFFINRIFQFTR